MAAGGWLPGAGRVGPAARGLAGVAALTLFLLDPVATGVGAALAAAAGLTVVLRARSADSRSVEEMS